jgi:leucyl/phenylalanyl-tRNA--protein transferase
MKLFIEKRRFFPNPVEPTLDGIVSMGDVLTNETLLEAYSFGIFPWPHPDLPCLWFCPETRGVLDFSELHIGRSLEKEIRKTNYRYTVNKDFSQVIDECAKTKRPGQAGTWVTPLIKNAYLEFHKAGYAHSLECWDGDELVGGMYGVYVAGVFSGESMFYKRSNASKLCLIKLIDQLKQNGLSWMDIQMVTDVTERLGGKYIPKLEFLKRVEAEKSRIKKNPIQLKWSL